MTSLFRRALAISAILQFLHPRIYTALTENLVRLGDGAENTDTHGIDGLIFGLVARTIAAGRRLRLLQSGLIHRELALTVMGIAVIAAVLLILPMSS